MGSVCVCVFRYGVVRMVGLVFEVCVCIYIGTGW